MFLVTQIRSKAGAEYADLAFTPPGELRPTARRENFLFLPAVVLCKSLCAERQALHRVRVVFSAIAVVAAVAVVFPRHVLRLARGETELSPSSALALKLYIYACPSCYSRIVTFLPIVG